jgi:hypothetical protein
MPGRAAFGISLGPDVRRGPSCIEPDPYYYARPRRADLLLLDGDNRLIQIEFEVRPDDRIADRIFTDLVLLRGASDVRHHWIEQHVIYLTGRSAPHASLWNAVSSLGAIDDENEPEDLFEIIFDLAGLVLPIDELDRIWRTLLPALPIAELQAQRAPAARRRTIVGIRPGSSTDRD